MLWVGLVDYPIKPDRDTVAMVTWLYFFFLPAEDSWLINQASLNVGGATYSRDVCGRFSLSAMPKIDLNF